MTIIIDGDSLVYKAAGAAQHKNKETGEMEYEPVSHALNNAKTLINKILSRLDNRKYVLYLTSANDDSAYRKKLYPEYKANRKAARPKYYQDVRDYYEKYWKANIISYWEADDAVCMRQHEEAKGYFDIMDWRSIIAGIDKDLLQIPGMHYNYDKDYMYYIDQGSAFKYLMKQILAGDIADNIPRIKKRWIKTKTFNEIDNKCYTFKDTYDIVLKTVNDLGIDKEEIINRGRILLLHRHKNDSFEEYLHDHKI